MPLTSKKRHLILAVYAWITENNGRPHVLIHCGHPEVKVPPHLRGKPTLFNISMQAAPNLEVTDTHLQFAASFGGVHSVIYAPMDAIMAVYSPDLSDDGILFQEACGAIGAPPVSGQVTVTDKEGNALTGSNEEKEELPVKETPPDKKPPFLRVVK